MDTEEGLQKNLTIYICTYGEDCSNTQHLKEVEFIKAIRERGLPKYDRYTAKTYNQLLKGQSKTDIGRNGG